MNRRSPQLLGDGARPEEESATLEGRKSHMTAERSRQTAPWFRFPAGLVLLALLIVAGSFVVTEHAAHLLGALPYLLLLACPLLHFFHRGHGGGHGGNGSGEPKPGAGEDR